MLFSLFFCRLVTEVYSFPAFQSEEKAKVFVFVKLGVKWTVIRCLEFQDSHISHSSEAASCVPLSL